LGGDSINCGDYFTGEAETQVWAEIAFHCGYFDKSTFQKIDEHYNRIIGKLVRMIDNPNPWLIVKTDIKERGRR